MTIASMHHLHPHHHSGAECERKRRQHDEICTSIAGGRLHHAADLAHEHLAEFTDDDTIRTVLLAALDESPDPQLRRRRSEFEI
jgi:hypothetical protein